VRAVLPFTLLPAIALASGFAIPEQSAKSMGMGGAGVAADVGAASVYYNPGALGWEEGIAAELGGTLIIPAFKYEPLRAIDGLPASAKPQVFVLPTLFAGFPVGPIHLGVGVFSNFGLGLEWPESFDGRFEALSSSLQTFTINATVAWKIHRHVSIGAGFDLVRATVQLSQKLNMIDAEGKLTLGGGTWGAGANAGIATHWLDGDRLSIGFTYRSAVSLGFEGRADFVVPAEFEATLRDQAIRTTIVLPHVFTLGFAFKPVPKLQLTLDASYTTWSTIDAFRFDFEDDALDQELRRDWVNTFTFRLGGQWEVVEKLTIRAGFGFDQSPAPAQTLSPSLPDAHRLFGALGVGYRLGNFAIDAAYLLAGLLPRQSAEPAFPGRYSGLAHVIGLTLSFRQ
jgi:long-chain fatty acid transport protein